MNYRYINSIITTIFLAYSGIVYAQSDKAGVERMALDLRQTMKLESVAENVFSARVVYVGETHDSYADHMTQLDIIRRLHAYNPNIAIGMEQFQQPFQGVLDRFIRGEIEERELIRQSEWAERWRYDYRLYRPILSYAREHHIPVIALNVSKEIVAKVSEHGIDGLTDDDRSEIPGDIDDSDQEYRKRLKEIYENHAHKGKNGFEGFLQVQLLWDESMAARAVEYLRDNPERQLVVLAGSGHLMHGSGIPQRVSRRLAVERAIILPAGDFVLGPNIADYLVQGSGEQLPEKGLLGIHPGDGVDGVVVKDLVAEGAAEKAGVERDDVIRSVNGNPTKDKIDLDFILMDTSPGDKVKLEILRKKLIQEDKVLELVFDLGR